MNYYTGIINNFNNIDPEGMLQTNSITISVNNDAVNYAKGNTQGIIEIPNRIWSSIISNVTFPDKSFFNRLFINVSGVVNEQTLNVQDKTIDITTNGTRTVTPDVGYQGLGEVTINTNVPSGVNNQNKSLVIRSNGDSVISPDIGYSGIGNLDLTVEVPSDINNENKTLVVNSNGSRIVRPDSGYSGIGELSLTVNVPSDINNQNKTITVTNNGYTTVEYDQGYSGLNRVDINVNVPQPVIQENDIRYIIPSNEARQIIVEPNEGYDALQRVTLNVSSATLAENQIILNIESNGLYSLPSVAGSNVLGFADSCKVNVNVETLTKDFISKMRVFYSGTPVSQTEKLHSDVNVSDFVLESDDSFSVNQGYSYLIIYENSGFYKVGYLNANSNSNISLPDSPSSFYIYSFGPAKYIEVVSYRDSLGEVVFELDEFMKNDEHVSQGRLILSKIPKKFFGINFENE